MEFCTSKSKKGQQERKAALQVCLWAMLSVIADAAPGWQKMENVWIWKTLFPEEGKTPLE